MIKLGILEQDLEERFIKGSGAGGQKINKTSSCVYLKHIPTGVEVKCQWSRSQADNRYFARRELCEKIAARIHGEKTKKQQAFEKIRRQKRRRSRRSKEKMLEAKRQHSEKKSFRRPVD
jgi:protein subunit release factor B